MGEKARDCTACADGGSAATVRRSKELRSKSPVYEGVREATRSKAHIDDETTMNV